MHAVDPAAVASGLPAHSLPAAVAAHAMRTPDAPAILAPERAVLTYGALWRQVQEAGAQLRAWGVTRGDRVAFALPDGPEGAVLLLSVITVATAVPLNPDLSMTELEAWLAEVRASVLIVLAEDSSSAMMAAQSAGIPVITLTALPEAAGLFRLRGAMIELPVAGEALTLDDVALVLRTSGTTSRPKVAPLTHRNLWAMAHDTVCGRELTSDDRCLVMAHLFHVYGIILEVGTLLVRWQCCLRSRLSDARVFHVA